MAGGGSHSKEFRKRMKEIRRLKEKLKSYAEHTLDLTGLLDDSRDLVEQVREKLEEVLRESEVITEVITLSGERFNAKDILEFINSAPQYQIEMFREYLAKELARRKKLLGDMKRIAREIERYTEELGVYVPFDIIDYDKMCFEKDECYFLFKVEIGGSRYLDEYRGSIEDLIELFKKVVAQEAKKMLRLISHAKRERSRVARELIGFKEMLEEIERHIYSTAILTISGTKLSRPRSWGRMPDEIVEAFGMGLDRDEDMEIIKWDARRLKDGFIVYGANPHLWPDFYTWFKESLLQSRVLTILLRSFRREIDEITRLPIKEIRGYIARIEGLHLKFTQLSARELLEAYTKDPKTGKALEPEPAVIFCGPNDEKIYSTASYK
ncbi:MAG: hypothetical protein ACO2O0_04340 [Desulfurococcales archaeon]|jgi:hypothetical protein